MRFTLLLSALLLAASTAFAVDMDDMKDGVAKKETAGQKVVIADAFPEHVMGEPTAPVTLIEYASLTCGHCAHFHKEILPKLVEKYISTGKVKLIYRDFPLDANALKAAQLAQCMPEERYFPFVKTLFEMQANWAVPGADIDAALTQYAKLAGLPGDRAKACLTDSKMQEALVKRRMEAEKQFNIQATPSFVVNYGPDVLTGASNFEEFEKGLLKYVKDVPAKAGDKNAKPTEVKPVAAPAPAKDVKPSDPNAEKK